MRGIPGVSVGGRVARRMTGATPSGRGSVEWIPRQHRSSHVALTLAIAAITACVATCSNLPDDKRSGNHPTYTTTQENNQP